MREAVPISLALFHASTLAVSNLARLLVFAVVAHNTFVLLARIGCHVSAQPTLQNGSLGDEMKGTHESHRVVLVYATSSTVCIDSAFLLLFGFFVVEHPFSAIGHAQMTFPASTMVLASGHSSAKTLLTPLDLPVSLAHGSASDFQ